MMIKRCLVWIMWAGLLCSSAAFAEQSFTIKHIKIQGLHRISQGAVKHKLAVHVGDRMDAHEGDRIIHDLYQTGYFSNISLARAGQTLIVSVKERPIISDLTITGNKAIKNDDLMKGLRKIAFVEGRVYRPSVAKELQDSIQQQYFLQGYYDIAVSIKATPQGQGKVAVHILVKEHGLAIVRSINIVGNRAFSEKVLLKQMHLTRPGLFTWISHADRFSTQALQDDLRSLTLFYANHGYLKFKIDSHRAALSTDKRNVYITIHVSEGQPYSVGDVTLTGKTYVKKQLIMEELDHLKGQVYSRRSIMAAQDQVSDLLGEHGYAFAKVMIQPKINDSSHTVALVFAIDQGKKVYVHRIRFQGNAHTNDEVLRSNMAQVEGGVVNTVKIKQSKRQLNQLPFIRDLKITQKKRTGYDDQMDLDVSMTQVPAGQISGGIGYSDLDGIILNASVVQKDFLGTGRTVGVSASHSSYQQTVNLNYINPYYTSNGISRGVNLFATRTDPGEANITSSYSLSEYGANVFYGIPMKASASSTDRLSLGYGIDLIKVNQGSDVSTQVEDFINEYGRSFNEFTLSAGWVHNGLNRYIFPTAGFQQKLGLDVALPMDGKSLGYYKTNYNVDQYTPLSRHFIMKWEGNVGYGNGFIRSDDLPFFKNYYAGGIGSVRGYEGNTLGPRDSNDDPIGGNFLLDGSVSLIFPNFISPDNLRTSLFFDAGNVYDLSNQTQGYGFAWDQFRYGVGLDVQWLSPIGLLEFSLAKDLHKEEGDYTQVFDFRIGASF
jgi:outer membrane protein insertion porin family